MEKTTITTATHKLRQALTRLQAVCDERNVDFFALTYSELLMFHATEPKEDGDDFTSSGKEIPDTDPHISGSSTFAGLPKSGQEDNKAADESPSAARGERRKLEQELRKKQGQRGGESAQRKRQRLASDEVARKRAKPEPEPAPEVLSEEEENEDVLAFVREMRLPPVGSSATKRHMQREHMRR